MFTKAERSSTKGYQLYDFGSYWELHSAKGVFKGDLKKVCTYAVIELGFEIDELEAATLEMNNQFHNGAEFGVFKRFIFTFERKDHEKSSLH